MATPRDNKPVVVDASPAKAFFVEMITRDIELQDAILDLLDNCIDGVRRIGKTKGSRPYQGYYARITFSEDEFVIEDNCGGIPFDIAQKYAFMMGRPAEYKNGKEGTIGIYGIGMKRAIFKMGRSCVVLSHAQTKTFEVEITKDWLEDDKNWKLEARPVTKDLKAHGTKIVVRDLHKVVRNEFAKGSEFRKDFFGVVRNAYSFLLEKGFTVEVNGEEVAPKVPSLLWDKSDAAGALRPYIYRAEIFGVSVFLAVGFRERPDMPGDEESDAKPKYNSEDAGWTIVCNDRVTVPYDKGRQTGWGLGGVPSYHNQFIGIAGFVFFDGYPSDLPMTTTKRGVDANSDLYTIVREKMQSGVKHFTRFTNEWKGFDDEEIFKRAEPILVPEIERLVAKGKVQLHSVRGEGVQEQSVPNLPESPREITHKRISFVRPVKDIRRVSKWLFEKDDRRPSDVGAECFDFVLRKTK
jgi:Histidine kinase-, DNA gyrase B-, and HSP90-like ATPase